MGEIAAPSQRGTELNDETAGAPDGRTDEIVAAAFACRCEKVSCGTLDESFSRGAAILQLHVETFSFRNVCFCLFLSVSLLLLIFLVRNLGQTFDFPLSWSSIKGTIGEPATGGHSGRVRSGRGAAVLNLSILMALEAASREREMISHEEDKRIEIIEFI